MHSMLFTGVSRDLSSAGQWELSVLNNNNGRGQSKVLKFYSGQI